MSKDVLNFRICQSSSPMLFLHDICIKMHYHSAERITTVHAHFCISLNPHFTPLEVNMTPVYPQRASATRPGPRMRCAPRAWATACARRGTGASGATPARTDGGSRLYHNILIICYTLPDHSVLCNFDIDVQFTCTIHRFLNWRIPLMYRHSFTKKLQMQR